MSTQTGLRIGGRVITSYVFVSPEVIFFFGTPINLAPGQCASAIATWSPIDAAPGQYVTFGGAQNGGGIDAFAIHQPAGGIQLPILISSGPVPVLSRTWGGIKALYN